MNFAKYELHRKLLGITPHPCLGCPKIERKAKIAKEHPMIACYFSTGAGFETFAMCKKVREWIRENQSKQKGLIFDMLFENADR